MSTPKNKPGFKLAVTACAVAIMVVGLGAFTRLVDAGLGCPDWPGCYGHILWPNEAHEITKANEAWPDAPVELDKTWPEMVHRYFASGLGLFTIALLVVCLRNREQGMPNKHAWFLLAFICLQGAFGAWTVTLKLWPQVVTAHLLGGFTTFALLWLMVLRLRGSNWRLPKTQMPIISRLKPLAWVALVVIALQIALGGWVTSNYAAVACPDLPACRGEWVPDMDFKEGFNFTQQVGPNYLGGNMEDEARVAIHFSHRVGALVTTVIVLLLCIALIGSRISQIRPIAALIFGALVLQVGLGLGNVYFQFPLWVAVSHNLGGALLLLSVTTLLYHLHTARVRKRDQ